ncbi:MAG TPA: biotin--[acetyl-CoA-carboxylase] ligase [Thermoplasmata archaeon]|nr:biotin--[acetyl-CoA-carboxylase] ligase [Thermoplasmata archaeon]
MAERLVFDLLPSTQDEAIRRIRAGAEPGLTVVARRQHRGRGRLDHTWSSPEGGLYLSIAVPEPPLAPGLVPVGVGAGLSIAVHEHYGVATELKWPNDLLTISDGRSPQKLAGILVDRVISPTFGIALVVGIGLNASSPRGQFPPELAERVAILTELCHRRVEPSEVEPIAIAAVHRTVDRLASPEGRGQVLAECRRVLFGVGRPVRVDGRPFGVIRDLADDGALLVERDGGLAPVVAGEVELEGLA